MVGLQEKAPQKSHSAILNNSTDSMSTNLMSNSSQKQGLYIPASVTVPEITLKSVLLGSFLAILLAASTCYIGLKVGRTIAASIPAAVISIAVLRWFRKSNILENNMVQTIASAGEVVAAGIIFTIPALVIMGFWHSFDYFTTVAITAIGGFLGVLFSIPLRRVLIVEQKLPYPEGIATAEVLRAGDGESAGARDMLKSGALSALITFCQAGFKIFGESAHYWTKALGTVAGVSVNFSPVLLAAGYIVGMKVCFSMITGTILTWVIGIPLFGLINGVPEAANPLASVMTIYKSDFRYLAIGAMAIGGFWSVCSLIPSISTALKSSFAGFSFSKSSLSADVPRTERDLPLPYVVAVTGLISVPMFFLLKHLVDIGNLGLSGQIYWLALGAMVVLAMVIGFVCAAISSHLTGLIGSTSLPVSGIVIFAILVIGSLLLFLLSDYVPFSLDFEKARYIAGIVIMISGIISIATSLSSDNMQDLKAGYLVGSTPWKQQVMLIFGVLVASLVVAPVLNVLLNAYGFGDVLPNPGMDPTQSLQAPQATLMSVVSLGVFNQNLNMAMIKIGVVIGLVIIAMDAMLKKAGSEYRLPIIPVAAGMYLPSGYIIAFCIGGLISELAQRKLRAQKSTLGNNYEATFKQQERKGVLVASGFIAGEALMGIAIAVLCVSGYDKVLKIPTEGFEGVVTLLGMSACGFLCWLLYKAMAKTK